MYKIHLYNTVFVMKRSNFVICELKRKSHWTSITMFNEKEKKT